MVDILGDILGGTMKGIGNDIVNAADNGAKAMLKDAMHALDGLENTIMQVINLAVHNSVNAIMNGVKTINAQINTGDVTGAIISLLEIAIPIFIIFIIVDLLSTKVFGAGLDLSGLKKALEKFFSIELFVSAIVGAWVGVGLASPASQIANTIFRPSIPNEELAIEQFIRGNLTTAQVQNYLARRGVPDGDMMLLYDHMEQYPTVRQLATASEIMPVTSSDIQNACKYSNITMPANVAFYMKYFTSIALRSELSAYLAILKQDFLDGLIDINDLGAQIAQHQNNILEQQQIGVNIQASYTRNLVRQEISAETYLYKKGVYAAEAAAMNPAETPENFFYNKLVSIGVQPEVCNAVVRLAAAQIGIDWERA